MEKINKTRHSSYFNIESVPTTSISPETLSKRVSSTNKMMDDLITDYQGHEKADSGYKRLIKLDEIVKEIFDELNQRSPLKNSDAQLLSDLCKRLNEDPVLQEIRETHLDERLCGENACILPSIKAQNMSSLPGSPVKRTARIGHSRTILEFMEPKLALHEIAGLQIEDFTTNPTQPDQNAIYGYVDPEEVKKQAEMKFKTIQKLDSNIKEIVNHSLTRLDTRRANECETLPAQTEDEMNKYIQEERKKHIENLFTQMRNEFDNHRIEFAHKYFTEIQEIKQSNDYSEQSAFLAQKITQNSILLDDVEYTYNEVLKIMAELEDENGYEIEKAKKNVTIKYKNLPGGGVSLKLEAVVDVPLFNLLALNYEAEGFAQWTPFCKESKLVKRLSRASNAMWMKWDMPPPVSSREGYLIGSGFDRLDINGSILMIAKTIHKDPRLAARHGIDIPAKSKYVRMEIPYIGTDLVPISKTQTRMRLVTTFDPQIKFVPLSLSSWIARKGSIYLLETMVKHASTLEGSQWKIYLERSKDFYGWLEELLKTHGHTAL